MQRLTNNTETKSFKDKNIYPGLLSQAVDCVQIKFYAPASVVYLILMWVILVYAVKLSLLSRVSDVMAERVPFIEDGMNSYCLLSLV